MLILSEDDHPIEIRYSTSTEKTMALSGALVSKALYRKSERKPINIRITPRLLGMVRQHSGDRTLDMTDICIEAIAIYLGLTDDAFDLDTFWSEMQEVSGEDRMLPVQIRQKILRLAAQLK